MVEVNTRDEREVRRIMREELYESCEIDEIKTIQRGSAEGEVMVSVTGHVDGSVRNAFAGRTLAKFLEAGFVATSVGGGADSHTAWFQPVGVGIDVEI